MQHSTEPYTEVIWLIDKRKRLRMPKQTPKFLRTVGIHPSNDIAPVCLPFLFCSRNRILVLIHRANHLG